MNRKKPSESTVLLQALAKLRSGVVGQLGFDLQAICAAWNCSELPTAALNPQVPEEGPACENQLVENPCWHHVFRLVHFHDLVTDIQHHL